MGYIVHGVAKSRICLSDSPNNFKGIFLDLSFEVRELEVSLGPFLSSAASYVTKSKFLNSQSLNDTISEVDG